MEEFSLDRDVDAGTYPIRDLVTGLTSSPALQERAGGLEQLERHLGLTKLEIMDFEGYCWVDPNKDGCIVVATEHWRHGDDPVLYLDLVHELVHVLQHREGKELFDESYDYVDRPTEIDAYEITVQEARRIGMSDAFIREYLEVPWVDDADHARLCKRLGVRVGN